MNHTTTPWKVEKKGKRKFICDGKGRFVPVLANAERIVECVNLFHEIDKPTAYMLNTHQMLLKAGDAVNENEVLKKRVESQQNHISIHVDEKLQLINERDELREQVRKLSELTGQLTPSGLSGQTSSHTELSNESALFPDTEIEAHHLAELSAGANAEDTRNTMHDAEPPQVSSDAIIRDIYKDIHIIKNDLQRQIASLHYDVLERSTRISQQILDERTHSEYLKNFPELVRVEFSKLESISRRFSIIESLAVKTDSTSSKANAWTIGAIVLIALDVIIRIIEITTK